MTTQTATASPAKPLFQVIDRHTGQAIGRPYASANAARRRVDKLDNEYGAYRYTVRTLAA